MFTQSIGRACWARSPPYCACAWTRKWGLHLGHQARLLGEVAAVLHLRLGLGLR